MTTYKTEAPWTGAREILVLAGPIVIGSMSYTVMEFTDKFMVAKLGTEPLAAIGNAAMWSYTFTALLMGVASCVSTFVSQALGKDEKDKCASYTWQGIHLVWPTLVLCLVLYLASGPIFRAMGHGEAVTALETQYFNIRLLGYPAMIWASALAAFFMSIGRPNIPMYIAIFANGLNIILDYVLIFGSWGAPKLGIMGAAIATDIAQWTQVGLLHGLFMLGIFHRAYQTRSTWQVHLHRLKELWRVGFPGGLAMFLDVAIWAVFTGIVIGSFGDVALAAHTITISFLHISLMVAMAMNQAIAPIVGNWIGRGDPDRAEARTYTAMKMTIAYMTGIGLFFAFSGGWLIEHVFSDDPAVIQLGHRLLILCAIFQSFDAILIVTVGALRGAGDTKWILWITAFAGYVCFLPVALVYTFVFGGGPYEAWVIATVYVIGLSGAILLRFRGGYWRKIEIFQAEAVVPVP